MTQPNLDDLLTGLDLTAVTDPEARQIIVVLLNVIEIQRTEIRQLKQDNQALRDEINRLKGEQGKPHIPPGPPKGFGTPHHSEKERTRPRPHNKARKVDQLVVEREVKLEVPPQLLSEDALFKGYQSVVVQDLHLSRANVRFLKAKYYAPSTRTTTLAALPAGYSGQFGPTLKAFVLQMYYGCQVSLARLHRLVEHLGIEISRGQLATLLNTGHQNFHTEMQQVWQAGLASSPYQHYDHTGARVGGQNWSTHVLGNRFYSQLVTRKSHSRLAVLEVLMAGHPLTLVVDAQAVEHMQSFGVPQSKIAQVQARCPGGYGSLEQLQAALPKLGTQHTARVLEAVMKSAYQKHPLRVDILVSDDAPEFKNVTDTLALCWVHEGRHYKKLTPTLAVHQQAVAKFAQQFWKYYHKLKAYQRAPDASQVEALRQEFEQLFSTETGYWELDDRIKRTRAHQAHLLVGLYQPQVPLENNEAERSCRVMVSKREVSGGSKGEKGSKAWDTFLSLLLSCQKLGVSYFDYLYDRIAQAGQIAPLADILRAKVQASEPTPNF